MKKLSLLCLVSCLYLLSACTKADLAAYPEEPFEIEVTEVSCFDKGTKQ